VRPRTLVFVSGTGTEVGKTWWAAATARALRAEGVAVAARKPVQSSEPRGETDADALADATGEDPLVVCPAHRTFALAWAPPMAARELGLPRFRVRDLAEELAWTDVAVGFVEGAGGPRSPIADDGDNVDLAREIQPNLVLLVARAGLGTINAVRLATAAFDDFPLIVALNHYDDGDALHARNREYLVERADLDVVTAPSQLVAHLLTSSSTSRNPRR
jgi:dethiobiotin synthetase